MNKTILVAMLAAFALAACKKAEVTEAPAEVQDDVVIEDVAEGDEFAPDIAIPADAEPVADEVVEEAAAE